VLGWCSQVARTSLTDGLWTRPHITRGNFFLQSCTVFIVECSTVQCSAEYMCLFEFRTCGAAFLSFLVCLQELYSRLPLAQLDPSLALGFYCSDSGE